MLTLEANDMNPANSCEIPDRSLVYALPQPSTGVISAGEYQTQIKAEKTQKGRLRVCLRVLSSMGYNSNPDDKMKEILSKIMED